MKKKIEIDGKKVGPGHDVFVIAEVGINHNGDFEMAKKLVDEAKKSGAEVIGSDDLIEKISLGKFDFTKLICTPAMMSKIGKHGKVLGPKGLMPNPKLGTVTNDISKAVNDIKKGLVEIRNDKDGNLASTIGRKSFSNEKLLENYKHFIDSVKKEKPDTIKGEFIKNIFITSTMGISYKVRAK